MSLVGLITMIQIISINFKIDVLVMYYLTSRRALGFILGWLTYAKRD